MKYNNYDKSKYSEKLLVKIIKVIRKILTFWIAKYDVNFVESIRKYEIEFAHEILKKLGKNSICEIGGGAGWQKEYLNKLGWDIRSFDLITTNYMEFQLKGVEVYDGVNLPLCDASVDIIFSSNTLEHVKNLSLVFEDHQRVLKDDGYCLHILPSSSWRIWTNLTDVIKKFHWDNPHGEFSVNVFEEIQHFSVKAWKKRFREANFDIIQISAGNLFYTGNTILSKRLPIKSRKLISRVFGSSCYYYLLKKSKEN